MASENDSPNDKALDEDRHSALLDAQADFTREIARAASAQSRDLLE